MRRVQVRFQGVPKDTIPSQIRSLARTSLARHFRWCRKFVLGRAFVRVSPAEFLRLVARLFFLRNHLALNFFRFQNRSLLKRDFREARLLDFRQHYFHQIRSEGFPLQACPHFLANLFRPINVRFHLLANRCRLQANFLRRNHRPQKAIFVRRRFFSPLIRIPKDKGTSAKCSP